MEVVISQDILKANDTIAERIQANFERTGIFAVNLLGSPGSGKTTLLEQLAKHLSVSLRVAVVEGDLATSKDAERIEKLGWPTVQINTGGGCHLEANMVEKALASLPLNEIDLLFIENVGNLVCTAGHKLGEHLRLVILSCTEGDDKVTKYPPMFQKTNAIVLNKTDLLPFTDFNVEQMEHDARLLNPDVEIMQASSRTGEGVETVAHYLLRKRDCYLAETGH